jgi:hypothetical protein
MMKNKGPGGNQGQKQNWERDLTKRVRRSANQRKPGHARTVSFVLPAGCTHEDEIRETAKQLGWDVAPLPAQLRATSFPRGKTVFQPAANVFDEIAEQYGLDWGVESGVFRLFDRKLVSTGQLSEREMKIWAVIQWGGTGPQYCRELDNAGIAPLRLRRFSKVTHLRSLK